jgi:hypothetical protein
MKSGFDTGGYRRQILIVERPAERFIHECEGDAAMQYSIPTTVLRASRVSRLASLCAIGAKRHLQP